MLWTPNQYVISLMTQEKHLSYPETPHLCYSKQSQNLFEPSSLELLLVAIMLCCPWRSIYLIQKPLIHAIASSLKISLNIRV
jgi:hypothetical protein